MYSRELVAAQWVQGFAAELCKPRVELNPNRIQIESAWSESVLSISVTHRSMVVMTNAGIHGAGCASMLGDPLNNQPRKELRASFTIGDVMCPNVIDILRSAGPGLAVRGRVLYFSDDGQERDGFAVMDVEGIASPMVVPVECLRNFVEDAASQPVEVCDSGSPSVAGARISLERADDDCVRSLSGD